MSKSPKMNEFLDKLSQSMFGRKRRDCIEQQICTYCGKPAVSFKDELSKKEYSISGICQECQDGSFLEG